MINNINRYLKILVQYHYLKQREREDESTIMTPWAFHRWFKSKWKFLRRIQVRRSKQEKKFRKVITRRKRNQRELQLKLQTNLRQNNQIKRLDLALWLAVKEGYWNRRVIPKKPMNMMIYLTVNRLRRKKRNKTKKSNKSQNKQKYLSTN